VIAQRGADALDRAFFPVFSWGSAGGRAAGDLGDQLCDEKWPALVAYGPHKTICNRSIGWSRLGVGNGSIAIRHDPVLFRQPHKIEIMSGRLKNRRHSHTRCHRSAHAFFSATRIAATVIVWPGQ
jgi:transposase